MRFDLSRQPLVPAFLTLLLFTVLTVCRMGVRPPLDAPHAMRPAPSIAATQAAAGPAPAPQPTDEAPDGRARRGRDLGGRTGGAHSVVPLPSESIGRFQAARPGWARLLAALSLLYAGLCLGRMTVRRNLYAVGTCIAMPLFGMAVCLLPAGGEGLAAYVAASLLALSIEHCGRAYRNGYAFDSVFRASLCLGTIPLLVPAALPLYLLLPFAVLLLRRTVRETLVAGFGVALPAALFAYADWGAGGGCTAALMRLGSAFREGVSTDFVSGLPPATLLALGSLAGLALVAAGLFLADLYAVGNKARALLLYTLGVFVLTWALLCGPAASPALFGLLAVPAAVLAPLFFVRVRPLFAAPLYLLLAAAAAARSLMQ